MSSSSSSSSAQKLLPIFLIVLVDIFGMTLVIPLLPIYAERFHASPLQATLLVSVYAACQLVSGPMLGRASDRTGRKPMLLISQVGTLAGFLVLARASSLWMIVLARVIDGATAGNISLAQAYLSDNTEPKDRARGFALIGISFGIGFFLGPFLTGYLSHAYGLTAPIYLAAALSLTSIACTALLLPGGAPAGAHAARAGAGAVDDPGPGGRRLALLDWGAYVQYFRRPVLGGLLLQFFFYALSFTTFTSGFALFAERTFVWKGHPFGPREIGYLFAYVGFLGIILQGGIVGRLVRRVGEPPLVSAGFFTLALSYVVLGLTHRLGVLVALSTVSSFGNAVARPVLSSLVTQRAGRHEQGVVLGLNQSLNSVAGIVAPALGGFLIEHGQLRAWAWVAAAAAAAGLLAARWGSALAARADAPAPG